MERSNPQPSQPAASTAINANSDLQPAARPIGLFDSGVGGVSVLREVVDQLPAEDLVYLADTEWCPYGEKAPEDVRRRALAVGRWLVDRGAKAIVVACNTASAAALPALRAELSVPVVGMEPAVKPAAELTRTARVGVLATSRTVDSDRLVALIQRYAGNVEVLTRECPELVPLVEQGELSGPRLRAALQGYLQPLLDRQVDVLVLGCTHYPLIQQEIAALCGPGVHLVNPAPAVARQLARVIAQHDLASRPERHGGVEWWTTGQPRHFATLLAALGYPASPSRAAIQIR